MAKSSGILNLSILATLGLFGLASFLPLESLWGINHMAFLPVWWTYLYVIVVIAVVGLMLWPDKDSLTERLLERVDNAVFGHGIWPRVAIAFLFTVVFYFNRAETHFLGDGYTLLSIFGHPLSYVHRWTEPGSPLIVRLLQHLMGGFSMETALHAFQVLSIASGFVFVLNILAIVKRLQSSPKGRFVSTATLLSGGVLLLFFGYVEWYPVLWACATLYVRLALKYADDSRGLVWVLVAFAASTAMHLQAIYLLPGLLVLIVTQSSILKSGSRKAIAIYCFGSVVGVGAVATFLWLYFSRPEFALIFLGPLDGLAGIRAYSFLSATFLLDVTNLVFFVYPGVLTLMTFVIYKDSTDASRATRQFLVVSAIGSVIFLVVIDPVLGLGRDWDLMSLTLLAPVLLALLYIRGSVIRMSARSVLGYLILCCFITVTTVTVNVMGEPSEERFYSILKTCPDARGRSGWAILANYFSQSGRRRRAAKITSEMDKRFPDYVLLQDAYRQIKKGRPADVFWIAHHLLSKNPYNADFLQLLGTAFAKTGELDSAVILYERAVAINPYAPMMKNELGQIYVKQAKYDEALSAFQEARGLAPEKTGITEGIGLVYVHLRQFDSALVWADTLFATDRNSPGGHLLNLVVSLHLSDSAKARFHYREFLKHGQNRSDYADLREYYKYVD